MFAAGLSLTGSHLMCGDFLYSGHTVMLTLSYLFISECEWWIHGTLCPHTHTHLTCACVPDSPRWMWWYRWFCWLLSASGVVCILVAHEHYSIDVVIGYFVTTRTFWWYHAMADARV